MRILTTVRQDAYHLIASLRRDVTHLKSAVATEHAVCASNRVFQVNVDICFSCCAAGIQDVLGTQHHIGAGDT